MYDIFSDFFNGFDFFPYEVKTTHELRCPVCGRTLTDFKKYSKLGCGECYRTFRPVLTDTMRQIHPNPIHKGKIPKGQSAELLKKRHLEDLKSRLQNAVKCEDYELAAKLHKEIKDIEGQN